MDSPTAELEREVERLANSPRFRARETAVLLDSLTLREVKRINRIVGRATMSLAATANREYKPDIPDYQRVLEQYVALKRRLGLYRRQLVNDIVTSDDLRRIGDEIEALELGVHKAREEARRLRYGAAGGANLRAWRGWRGHLPT